MKMILTVISVLLGLGNSALADTPISQSAAQLQVAQVDDPQNPGRLSEYGLLRVKIQGAAAAKIKALKIVIPAYGESVDAFIGKSRDIIIEKPDFSGKIEFKVDQTTAEILWVLHDKRNMSLPVYALLEGSEQFVQIPQNNNLVIEPTTAADQHDPSHETVLGFKHP